MSVTEISPIFSSARVEEPTAQFAKKELGSQDFLKLLTVQLANQDPLSPMEDTAFISQMSTFSSLEQMSNLNLTMTQFTQNQMALGAHSYLGKEVVYTDETGRDVSGVVTSVAVEDNKVVLTADGYTFDATRVKKVSLSGESA